MRMRFVWLSQEIDKQCAMPAPKKITDRNAWLKTARKTMKEIPDWPMYNFTADIGKVVMELRYGGDFCHVVIDRKASSLG